ncbi:MAG: LruC domain-containing protein, partial [Leptospira sp.]|nr:LruC domain-containing protein [Leptospira sp.]
QISRFLVVGAQITPIIISDRDQDGVADSQDAYPDDPLRASLIRIPAESYYTIAYEDLYPKKGDADFNDFVVQVYNEQDLNAKGEIVRIRGHYTHVAKGAGYNHTLNLNFPGLRGSSYSLKRYGFTGALENELPGTIPDSGIVELLPSSNTTIAASNSQPNTVLKTGKSAEIEITLNTPKTTAGFSPAPYDLFLHVITTNRDIHFLGNLFKPDGTDQYLDSDGFPWAIQIPGNWKWPYEQKDIRNAYEFFDDWYISKGMEKKDWYNFPNQSLVFPN